MAWVWDDPALLQTMQCIQTETTANAGAGFARSTFQSASEPRSAAPDGPSTGYAAPRLSFPHIVDRVRRERPISRALIVWTRCG